MQRSPFGSVLQIHRELDDLLSQFFGHDGALAPFGSGSEMVTWWPAVETYAKDGQLHVRAALPGIDPKDVEVTVSNDDLTIRGERKAKTEHGTQYAREFAYGAFERTLALPEGIDPG
jgi:HSP20 family protein